MKNPFSSIVPLLKSLFASSSENLRDYFDENEHLAGDPDFKYAKISGF